MFAYIGETNNLIHKSRNGILHSIQVIEHFRKEINDIENLHKTCLVILFYLLFHLTKSTVLIYITCNTVIFILRGRYIQ